MRIITSTHKPSINPIKIYLSEGWNKTKLCRFTNWMMNLIYIQKLRIIIYKILLNFDDDNDDEEFCILKKDWRF
jgi:hypothetical protein